ncbi:MULTISPECIES: AAA family ATPase [Virgibacillus]|uniref:Nuclease SbcCD subunit C n=1 Tax=Virgibacillus massiliensis TaxID=1462526 RepID=A0A024QBE2_9BACI|nr:AAA family ATPase [Virgibacillus massiliensis]CDQ39863.1 Nuclease SbcCD subunit C [Virgibacillus massiliensis]
MRAISLSFKAFGPYLEKQTIDFRQLGDESIFLITGPTGSGKTTIFDAICYALYGKASGSDRDQDTLRSHFAGMSDTTEVEFCFSLNERMYVVQRNPKQVKPKERGEGFTDEPARAELYEMINNTKSLITSRIKDVNEAIENRLGFDYEQFRKMVLIPQGEFRKLISENSKERENILQKIFHTHLYEQMTEQLKADAKDMKEEIGKHEQLIEFELNKIEWTHHAPGEEIHRFRDHLLYLENEINQNLRVIEQQTQNKTIKQKELIEAQERLDAAKRLEEKFIELEKRKQEKEELNQRVEAIETNKEILSEAKTAQHIIPFEEQKQAREAEWNKQKEELKKQQERINHIQAEFEQVKSKYNQEKQNETQRETLKEEVNQTKKYRDQVTHLIQLKQEASQMKQERMNEEKKLASYNDQLKQISTNIDRAEVSLKEDENITEAYYKKKAETESIADHLFKLEKLQIEYEKLVNLRQEYQKLKDIYRSKHNQLTAIRNKLEKMEQEQHEHYASILVHQLKPGQPCPVCGSEAHPHKVETVWAKEDPTTEIDQLKQEVKRKEADFQQEQQRFIACQSNGKYQKELVDKLYEEIKEWIPTLNIQQLKQAYLEQTELHKTQSKELAVIENKLLKNKQLKEKRDQLKRQYEEFKQTFDQISSTVQQTVEKDVKLSTSIDELSKLLPSTMSDPESVEKELQNKEAILSQLMETWLQVEQHYQKVSEQLQRENTIMEQRIQFEKNTKENFDYYHRQFLTTIEDNGFVSIEAYHKAKRAPDEIKELENEITTFENQVMQLNYRIDELNNEIKGKDRPNSTYLENVVSTLQEEIQALNDHIYALHMKRKNDLAIKEQLDEHLQAKEALEKEYYTIGELAELANGNNQLKLSFERYVLASFLDEILLQSNLRLDRMTNHRYQLIRSGQVAKRGAQSGLDLEVLDHHTGQQRSVRTLSGGEGFKAALSLALGLADVVQAHTGGVKLDTLFIDEGFGTLDEVSLQQAIDCLKDLQDNNRLLGIISHVPQLKNEIHAKLQITPTPQGSKLGFRFDTL